MHVIYQFLHDYWFLSLFSVMGPLLLNIGLNKRGLFLNNKRDLLYCILVSFIVLFHVSCI